MVPLKQIEYGVYGDLITTYPKPYSIYLRGTIVLGSVQMDAPNTHGERDPRSLRKPVFDTSTKPKKSKSVTRV